MKEATGVAQRFIYLKEMKLGIPRYARSLVQEKVKAHAPQPYSCKQGTNDKAIPPTLQGQSETTITGNFPGRVLP